MRDYFGDVELQIFDPSYMDTPIMFPIILETNQNDQEDRRIVRLVHRYGNHFDLVEDDNPPSSPSANSTSSASSQSTETSSAPSHADDDDASTVVDQDFDTTIDTFTSTTSSATKVSPASVVTEDSSTRRSTGRRSFGLRSKKNTVQQNEKVVEIHPIHEAVEVMTSLIDEVSGDLAAAGNEFSQIDEEEDEGKLKDE
jgi:hypothetical protein